MKLALMQPYLFPYLGYIQLVAAADRFVLYDDVGFRSGGWINRNRLLDPVTGTPFWLTVPVRAGRRINETAIAGPARWREKLLRRIEACYRKAPYFASIRAQVETSLMNPEPNLAAFLRTSLEATLAILGIETPLVGSSAGYGNADLAASARVIDIVQREGASTYLNAEGGRALYSPAEFAARGLRLEFLEHVERPYPQSGGHPFVPRLSILDVLMHNHPDEIRGFLADFRLTSPD